MKNVLIFVGGMVVGAAGALFWLRKEFNAKLEEAQMRIETIEKEVEDNTKKVEKNSKKINSTTAKMNRKVREYNKMCEKHGYSTENSDKSDVEALIRDSRKDLDSEDGDDDLPFEEPSSPSEGIASEPYAISDKDFIYGNKEDFEKVTVFYYRGDDILAEEDGTVIEDWRYNVGEDWKDAIGKFIEDEAYIRNEKLSTDYNIVCEDLNYSDEWGEEE